MSIVNSYLLDAQSLIENRFKRIAMYFDLKRRSA